MQRLAPGGPAAAVDPTNVRPVGQTLKSAREASDDQGMPIDRLPRRFTARVVAATVALLAAEVSVALLAAKPF